MDSKPKCENLTIVIPAYNEAERLPPSLEKIVAWAEEIGLVLINFSPGTGSNADYTTPSMREYRSSERIFDGILAYEKSDQDGLNGFLLLLHIGTHPDRKDKFYLRLEELTDRLSSLGYGFKRVDEMLADCGS